MKEIKMLMECPDFDRKEILQMQRKMLAAKKERMERLIAGIDDILKGDSRMDFAVFNKTEMEEMFEIMYDHMPVEMRETAVRRKLIKKRGVDLHSFEVREIIGEYGFIMKQLTQVKEERGVMLQLARSYRDERCRDIIDAEYGEGAAEFFARAIEAFYATVQSQADLHKKCDECLHS